MQWSSTWVFSSTRDIVRREGFDLALDIGPGVLPGRDADGRERGLGTVLMGTAALTLSLGAAAVIVILALSKFYSEREQAPVLVEIYVQQTETAPDGTRPYPPGQGQSVQDPGESCIAH